MLKDKILMKIASKNVIKKIKLFKGLKNTLITFFVVNKIEHFLLYLKNFKNLEVLKNFSPNLQPWEENKWDGRLNLKKI